MKTEPKPDQTKEGRSVFKFISQTAAIVGRFLNLNEQSVNPKKLWEKHKDQWDVRIYIDLENRSRYVLEMTQEVTKLYKLIDTRRQDCGLLAELPTTLTLGKTFNSIIDERDLGSKMVKFETQLSER